MWIVTEQRGIPAQDFSAAGVKSAYPGAQDTFPEEHADTCLHLARGFIRKSNCEDIVRIHVAFIHEICVSVRKHARLTAACAREHEQRPVAVRNSLVLFFI